jgi:hypothetical protein
MVVAIPTATAPLNLPCEMLLQCCSVHNTQNVNTGGALAANKSARVVCGPPKNPLMHVCCLQGKSNGMRAAEAAADSDV